MAAADDDAVTDDPVDVDRVRAILEHPAGRPWRMQDVGLLALWLDDRRERRLHVWDPDGGAGEPPVHDHPFDFTSVVVAGATVNTRYVDDPLGVVYDRHRYRPDDPDGRRTDAVRLTGVATTLGPGARYAQPRAELHRSDQVPGTVTLIRFGPFESRELTVCLPPGAPFVSGVARPATPAEVRRVTGLALDRLRER